MISLILIFGCLCWSYIFPNPRNIVQRCAMSVGAKIWNNLQHFCQRFPSRTFRPWLVPPLPLWRNWMEFSVKLTLATFLSAKREKPSKHGCTNKGLEFYGGELCEKDRMTVNLKTVVWNHTRSKFSSDNQSKLVQITDLHLSPSHIITICQNIQRQGQHPTS